MVPAVWHPLSRGPHLIKSRQPLRAVEVVDQGKLRKETSGGVAVPNKVVDWPPVRTTPHHPHPPTAVHMCNVVELQPNITGNIQTLGRWRRSRTSRPA